MSDREAELAIKTRIAQHGVPHKIEELCLDEVNLCYIANKVQLIGQCLRLQYLSLCECRLGNLSVLPELPRLQLLLEDSSMQALVKYPQLYSFNAENNQIRGLQWVETLSKLRIREIILAENPVSQLPAYKETMYRTWQDLRSLDGYDKMGNSAAPLQSSLSESESISESSSQYESEENRNQERQSMGGDKNGVQRGSGE